MCIILITLCSQISVNLPFKIVTLAKVANLKLLFWIKKFLGFILYIYITCQHDSLTVNMQTKSYTSVENLKLILYDTCFDFMYNIDKTNYIL